MYRNILGIITLFALLCPASPAADIAPQAREILAHARNSLITITSLSKLDMGSTGMSVRIGGLGEAQEASCSGLVIDPSGLTVVSYSALNPMERVAGALSSRMSSASAHEGVKVKTELSHVQMRLEDGSEVSASVVLKDKELDLAFIVPDPKEDEKLPSFTAVQLSAGVAAKELDDVVGISRHAKDLGYQPIVSVAQVTSVITKPRTMFDLSAGPRVGSPVFLPDGRLLGVTVTFGGGEGLSMLSARETLVLPAAEIAKLADQAKKAAEKKAKEAKKGESKGG